MATLNRRERTLVGLAVGALLIIVAYLYVIEPLVTRSRELAELAPAREATLEARRRLIAQRPRLTMEGDGEPMGFVPDPLNQQQPGIRRRQRDCIHAIAGEQQFLFLGNADRDQIGEAKRFERAPTTNPQDCHRGEHGKDHLGQLPHERHGFGSA